MQCRLKGFNRVHVLVLWEANELNASLGEFCLDLNHARVDCVLVGFFGIVEDLWRRRVFRPAGHNGNALRSSKAALYSKATTRRSSRITYVSERLLVRLNTRATREVLCVTVLTCSEIQSDTFSVPRALPLHACT